MEIYRCILIYFITFDIENPTSRNVPSNTHKFNLQIILLTFLQIQIILSNILKAIQFYLPINAYLISRPN